MATAPPPQAQNSLGNPSSGAKRKPTTSKGKLRRETLKSVTAQLLERVTYYELTLEQITRQAGIPTSVLYHYFENKRELVLELLDELFDELRQSILEAGPFGMFERGVLFTNRAILKVYSEHFGLMRTVAQVEDLAFAARWREHMNRWRSEVAHGLEEFAIEKVDPVELLALCHTMSAMSESFAHEYYVLNNLDLRKRFPDNESAAQFLTTIWVRAIFLSNPREVDHTQFPNFQKLRDLTVP